MVTTGAIAPALTAMFAARSVILAVIKTMSAHAIDSDPSSGAPLRPEKGQHLHDFRGLTISGWRE